MAIESADGKITLTTEVNDAGIRKGTATVKSQVAKLAAEYKKSGMDASSAWKKAWSEVDHTKSSTDKATKSTKEYGEQAQKSGGTAKSAFSSIGGALKKLAGAALAAFSVQKIIQFSAEASNLATTAEASVQRLIDIYGSASDAVGDFIDQNARALGMSKAAAASFSSVYGNLFSVWADQQTNAALTTQYLQMTAVVASKTGRTIEDVQERVRSGLLGNTEAIEDLGIFVNVKTIEMTDAFQRMAGGKSWEQLDNNTQQQIRSMAILEQSTAKYGNEVANTTALAKSRFQAAWRDFQVTWGQLVNAVLVPVLEWLTEILDTATLIINTLTGKSGEILENTQKVETETGKTTENIEDQTEQQEKLNKEIKKSLAGFDDLQILTSEISQTSSESDAVTPPVDIPEIPNSTQQGNEPKELSPFWQGFVDFVENIAEAWNKISQPLMEAFGNVISYILDKISNLSAEDWENIFTAVAIGIGAIVAIKITTTVINGISSLATALGGIHGVLFAIGAIALGSIIAFFSDLSNIDPKYERLENLSSKIKEFSEQAERAIEASRKFREEADKEFSDITTNALAIQQIADAYYNLSQNASFTEEDKHLLDYYYGFLIENGIDLVGKIDDVTKAYKGAREELQKLIAETMQQLVVQAAEEKIVESLKTKIDLQERLKEAEALLDDASLEYEKAQQELQDASQWIYDIENYTGILIPDFFFTTRDEQSAANKAWKAYTIAFNTVSGIVTEIGEVDKDLERYFNIITTGGESYLEGIFDGFEKIDNETVEPDFDPLLEDLDLAISSASSLGSALDALAAPRINRGVYTQVIIPRLAQGAVIPPNREFLAVLGDQRQGTNIETPLATMVEAFQMALDSRGGYSGGNTEVVLEIDGREFGRAVVEQGNRENRRIGTRLVIA